MIANRQRNFAQLLRCCCCCCGAFWLFVIEIKLYVFGLFFYVDWIHIFGGLLQELVYAMNGRAKGNEKTLRMQCNKIISFIEQLKEYNCFNKRFLCVVCVSLWEQD